tara:strand:- start:668 stop:1606 length:939 start_codon:yes stop_codon:yes gene_type:complete
MYIMPSLNKLAPIALFVYNRLWHTCQTINALQKNKLSSESELFIFSDGAKNDNVSPQVKEVRDYIRTIDGFKKVTIIEQDMNIGLAKSIIRGVTKIVNEYGRIIVLEDDIVTSPYFLKFMNESLAFYENEDKVWHISGWNYPIYLNTENDIYLFRLIQTWGWATWKKQWSFFEKNTNKLMKEFSNDDIKRFNVDNTYNLWHQVILNKYKYSDTWGVYWYATIFKNNGMCVTPIVSFVKNIGLDGSGQNCKDPFIKDNITLNHKDNITFITNVKEDNEIVNQIKPYLQTTYKSVFVKIINKLSRLILKNNFIK